MKCKDCACSDVCYYKAFNDVRAVKRRDDVEKVCKSFVNRDSIKVDAVEVVHSKWDTVFYERNGTLASYSHLCPECKYFYKDVRFKGHNYCANCGAKMDGDGNDI